MATWTSIVSLLAGTQPDLPILATKVRNIINNLEALGQRANGAPRSLPLIETFTTVGAQTWTVPDGVQRIKITAVGGGGHHSPSATGGTTTVSLSGVINIVCNGGAGGDASNNPAGGTATGGQINVNGGLGGDVGGGSLLGHGGNDDQDPGARAQGYGGGGGQQGVAGGGGGGSAIGVFSVSAGDVINITVGAGARADLGSATQGIVIIEH